MDTMQRRICTPRCKALQGEIGWTAFVCKLMRNIPWLSVIWILRHACKTHISYITTSESCQKNRLLQVFGGSLGSILGRIWILGLLFFGEYAKSTWQFIQRGAYDCHGGFPSFCDAELGRRAGLLGNRNWSWKTPVSTSSRNRCSMLALSLMNLMVCDMWWILMASPTFTKDVELQSDSRYCDPSCTGSWIWPLQT